MSVREEIRFRAAIRNSRADAAIVAHHLEAKGYRVEIAPERIRDRIENRAGHGDDADLYFWDKSGEPIGVEVKARSFAFTSAKDFPYRTIFVDRAVKADRSTVRYYVTLSGCKNHLLVVSAATKPQWVKVTKTDRFKGYKTHVYECPVELARFFPVESLF